ncbi:hypothetical protein N7448_004066 [Penicillium atrosanguineum]|uniref:Uncharacterized protein n=1 Tax=Penicillium atrosanguineum TaxID=1132637 RepID=A0A9W9H8L1_9EURO|nr:uncharacterized protein N7443_003028 [Penicillium atrosanguineum]KAJ5117117.1 hypothetical protein N7526_011226 [Penicillium atrosanguineum]KAJ5140658.1 hypothetical protein N7448_004066 [Penicillium atrosanguineum]KAJ5310567.1 hypothetical protein N7443_003028 [Penicillium atrosanguineum]KAJ5316088.1 hypothetical protein N7476_006395 [Penicillium atrosanguineum]
MLNPTDTAAQSRVVALAQVARALVTSVVTEIVRPTWIFTESVVVYTTSVTEDTSSPKTATYGAESAETSALQTSMQSLQMDTALPPPASTIVPVHEPATTTAPMENSASHTTAWSGFLGTLTIPTTWESVSSSSTSSEASSPSSPESSLSPTSLIPSLSGQSNVLSSMSPSRSTSTTVSKMWASCSSATKPSSPFHSPTHTPSTSVRPETSSSYSSSGKTNHHSPSTGVIVGSVIGGTAAVALGLLACILFFCRKRARSQRRQASRQGLLRTSESMSSIEGCHRRRSSQPSPAPPSSGMTSAPIFHQRRFSNPLDNRPSPPFGLSYPNLSHGRAYSYGETPNSPHVDPFADPEDKPISRALGRPLSPIIEISPPTRTASIYSRSSLEAGLKVAESHDSSGFSPYNCTGPTPSTLTLETLGSGSRCLNTPKSAYRRSDPFDLEPPPNTLQWHLPSAHYPNRWGDRF